MPRPATTLPEPRIATRRLLLRPLERGDLGRLTAEINDFVVARMLARVPHPYTRADAETFFAKLARTPAWEELNLVMIGDAGTLIGGIGLAEIPGRCEFGYWLGRGYWGAGYASEAARAFLAHAFDAFAIDIVRAGAFVDNPASLRVQEKLGFAQLGRRRVLSLARNAEVEHVDTVLTRERFREMRT